MTPRKKSAADTSTKSSFCEHLVEHVFVSEVLQEAWYAHGQIVEVLRSEIGIAVSNRGGGYQLHRSSSSNAAGQERPIGFEPITIQPERHVMLTLDQAITALQNYFPGVAITIGATVERVPADMTFHSEIKDDTRGAGRGAGMWARDRTNRLWVNRKYHKGPIMTYGPN